MTPRKRIIPIFVPHLGCPNDCVFCNQRRISGQTEPATAETVAKSIEDAVKKTGGTGGLQAAFYGGSFTAIEPDYQIELLEAARPYIESGQVESVRFSTRPDCIDEAVMNRLRPYKIDTIELGAQSMCDDVLLMSGRGHSAADTVRASKIIKAHGIKLILQMMTGLYGDTPEKSIYTAERIAELKPDGVRIYPTVIVKDTPLYDLWVAGKYREHTVEDAVELCSEIVPIFERASIAVIRLGLNPTEELSSGGALGGAYHPALGQMVQSRMYLKSARRLISDRYPDGVPETVSFTVSKGQTSAFVGQKRENIRRLCDEFMIKEIKVSETDEKVDKIRFLELKNNIT